jgi:hypothetical protein
LFFTSCISYLWCSVIRMFCFEGFWLLLSSLSCWCVHLAGSRQSHSRGSQGKRIGQREADAASATRLATCVDHGQCELAIPCAVVYVKKNYLTHLSVEVSLVCETSIVHTQFLYCKLIFGGKIMIEKNV